ncbi:GATA transcription factor 5-like [Apium graveolens]|uniref:GATA transcription factor 5-like n=1 Tax=Apium graveolens TaxID=4045 RepID=UPI003D795026
MKFEVFCILAFINRQKTSHYKNYYNLLQSLSLSLSLSLSVLTLPKNMDFCRNLSVSGGLSSEYEQEQMFPSSCSKLGSLDDMFSGNNMEEDMNLEWLSIYVEDCFSSSGNCLPNASAMIPQFVEKKTNTTNGSTTKSIPKPATPAVAEANLKPLQVVKPEMDFKSSMLHKFVIPGKARSKRSRGPGPIGNKSRRITSQFPSWSHNPYMTNSDPPLLKQTYWLADSELILPIKEENKEVKNEKTRLKRVKEEEDQDQEEGILGSFEDNNGQQQQQPRRCTHCLSQRTPQWRTGPLGPKTLCNACGVRYKSGRLLPEYRPAKSPTFVSYKHSNSHKKVLEMRTMSHLSTNTSSY